MPVPYVIICGGSGSGKTTLIEKLVKEFRSRGRVVGVLKHTECEIAMDVQGKDTWRFTEAGAGRVGIVSGRSIFINGRDESPLDLEDMLRFFDGVEFVIVEGFKHYPHFKIEVTAESEPSALTCLGDPFLAAVAGPAVAGPAVERRGYLECRAEHDVKCYSRDDVEGIASLIEERVFGP